MHSWGLITKQELRTEGFTANVSREYANLFKWSLHGVWTCQSLSVSRKLSQTLIEYWWMVLLDNAIWWDRMANALEADINDWLYQSSRATVLNMHESELYAYNSLDIWQWAQSKLTPYRKLILAAPHHRRQSSKAARNLDNLILLQGRSPKRRSMTFQGKS